MDMQNRRITSLFILNILIITYPKNVIYYHRRFFSGITMNIALDKIFFWNYQRFIEWLSHESHVN